MEKLDFLKSVYEMLKSPNNDSLKLSMADTHHKDLFSLVISGTEFGNLTRVFISDCEMMPYEVALHTHRYPIRLTTIKGSIKHYTAKVTDFNDCDSVCLSEFNYKSPLNGGGGLEYVKETNVILKDYDLPLCATINMNEIEYHSVSCSKGAIWIVEELGFKTDFSKVLGVPFITDNLYNPPASFQINDKCQLVAKELKKLILDYQTY